MFLSRLAPLLALVVTAGTGPAADWPGWRGPTGFGHTDDKKLPLTWNAKTGENVRWKAELPLRGPDDVTSGVDQNQSSPIVCRGRVFVTVSYWPGKTDPKRPPEHHVLCYRADDGKLLWNEKVEPGPWLFADLRGGYTAPTPAADDDRVYVVFGSSVVAALNHDGKPLWRREVKPFKFDVALAASPVLFGDTVILQCDELDKQSRIVALDKKTGDVAWEALRPNVGFAHSTPVVAEIGGKKQLLVAASNAIQGLDPTSGKVLWTCEAKGDTVSPVLGGGLVYLDSGRGGTGVAVDPTGTGDVTKTHLKWKTATVPEGYGSPVIVGEYLYRLHAPGVLKCLKLSTGEVVYSERLPGVSIHASPIAAPDGRIYLASAGKSYVVKAGEKFEILATNDLGDDSPASPAVADGRMFFKGRKTLYCVGEK
ncbi:MAG: PQQ-like beta-propeller repeat protein [Planctomycetes bacterium]|nr:PQQ-like beta-propeller repeat protein [Planctomycetota bacterium]